MVKVRKDLTGIVFGYLTVVKQVDDYIIPSGKKYAKYLCECKCGNTTEVVGYNLKRGQTRSCGCLVGETTSKTNKKNNNYEFDGDICICTTSNGDTFIFDSDKYDIVSRYCWWLSAEKYVTTHVIMPNRIKKNLVLHRLVTKCPDDKIVDHINGDPTDNRVCNLRTCNNEQNSYNTKCRKDNALGIKGVRQRPSGKYEVRIQYNGNPIHIGTFDTLSEASDAYDKKALELFGEFARLNNYRGNTNGK